MNTPSIIPSSFPGSLRAVLALPLFAAAIDSPAATITLVPTNAVWHHLDVGLAPDSSWTTVAFDDADWSHGPAQLGYGDGDERTTVHYGPDSANKYVTTYFRHRFEVSDATVFTNLTLGLLRDDGAVVYLNGVEVRRDNMPVGMPGFTTLATAAVGGSDEMTFFTSEIPAGLLVAGLNVVAVEVHQNMAASSDLSFDLELIAQTSAPTSNAPPIVQIFEPANHSILFAPADVLLIARGGDPEQDLRQVEFFAGTNSLGLAARLIEDTTEVWPPELAEAFGRYWTNVPVGRYELTARATDGVGNVTTSAPIHIAVLPLANAPVVTIVATDSQARERAFSPGVPDSATFELRRNGNTDHSLGVLLSVGGTATEGVDYLALSPHPGTLWVTIPAGASSTNVVVTPNDDFLLEGLESVELRVLPPPIEILEPPPPPAYWPGAPSEALAFIDDNSGFPNLALAEALDAPELVWRNECYSPPTPWTVDTNVTHDGIDAAVTSAYDDESSGCDLVTEVTGPGVVEFFWKVSNVPPFGTLSVSIGDYYSASISGEVDWQHRSFFVPSGRQRLVWRYFSGNPVWDETGAAWLDEVHFSQSPPPPPSIVIQPQNQTAREGDGVILSVGVIGPEPFGFQWQKDGVALSGRTNSTLTLATVQQTDAGRYRVIVANAAGSVTSTEATLTVLPWPSGPGALDLTFDLTAGGALPGLEGPLKWFPPGVRVVTLQTDGRVLAGGNFTRVNGIARPELARFHPNGALDLNFAPPLDLEYRVYALVVQPDGKVLVGGYRTVHSDRPTMGQGIMRLNADGSYDTSFNVGLGALGHANCISLLPDGRILLAGLFSQFSGVNRASMVRLHANGAVDTTFVPPAWIIRNDEPGDGINAMVVQPDGKIVVGGGAIQLNDQYVPVARLHSDGSLDDTFQAGIEPFALVWSLALQTDGRILVGGDPYFVDDRWRSGLCRFHRDGTADSTFTASLGQVHALLVQPDGRILAGGWDFEFTLLLPDGSPDPEFQLGPSRVETIALQPDGQIMVGGSFAEIHGFRIFGLARLTGPGIPGAFVRREITVGRTIRLIATPPVGTSVYAVEDQPPQNWHVEAISHGGVFDTATGKVKFGPFNDAESRTLSYDVFPPPGAQGVLFFAGTASADGVNSPIGGDRHWVLAGFHPAELRETRPADWILSIEEVTAYASAWRRGLNWMMPPNPIPIDYVTRSAFLWLGGECYTVNPVATNAPLWWVNCDAPRSADAPPAVSPISNLPTVQRQLPGRFVAGEPLVVTLSVLPSTARAYAIEEQCPPGWTVATLSDGGELDAVNGKLKWGPFFDNTPRTLSYRVTAPTTTGDAVSFAGLASFDGWCTAITGVGRVQATVRLSAIPSPRTSELVLSLSGAADGCWIIDSSTNLVVWTEWLTVTNALGQGELRFPLSLSEPSRFYRARLRD